MPSLEGGPQDSPGGLEQAQPRSDAASCEACGLAAEGSVDEPAMDPKDAACCAGGCHRSCSCGVLHHPTPSHQRLQAQPRSRCPWRFQSPAGGGRWGCGGVALPPEVGDSPSTGRRSRQRQLRTVADVTPALGNGDHVFTSCVPRPRTTPHTASPERFR